eukprot:m.777564 g.777564  ORF g.777564 m.777564 type:complete len:356 (+) comp23266_c0_seq5:1377-2444(+)
MAATVGCSRGPRPTTRCSDASALRLTAAHASRLWWRGAWSLPPAADQRRRSCSTSPTGTPRSATSRAWTRQTTTWTPPRTRPTPSTGSTRGRRCSGSAMSHASGCPRRNARSFMLPTARTCGSSLPTSTRPIASTPTEPSTWTRTTRVSPAPHRSTQRNRRQRVLPTVVRAEISTWARTCRRRASCARRSSPACTSCSATPPKKSTLPRAPCRQRPRLCWTRWCPGLCRMSRTCRRCRQTTSCVTTAVRHGASMPAHAALPTPQWHCEGAVAIDRRPRSLNGVRVVGSNSVAECTLTMLRVQQRSFGSHSQVRPLDVHAPLCHLAHKRSLARSHKENSEIFCSWRHTSMTEDRTL